MTLENRKHNFISKIKLVDDERILSRLEVVINNLTHSDDILNKLVRPVRKHLDIDALIKEQNYRGIDRQEFDQIVDELEIREPVEDLLEMLSA